MVDIGGKESLKSGEWLNILLTNSVFVTLDVHCNDYRFTFALKILYYIESSLGEVHASQFALPEITELVIIHLLYSELLAVPKR